MTQEEIEKAANEYATIKSSKATTGVALWLDIRFNAFVKGAEWVLEHQWVSVEDRLPETLYEVLVRVVDITEDDESFIVTYYDEDGWDGIYLPYQVTHWMEIPEKGGEK